MNVALITTSFPDAMPGSEAAGSFVAEFAAQLATRMQVSVVAAAAADGESREGDVDIVRFGVPRLPLSLLRAHDPRDWSNIVRTLAIGQRAVDRVVREQRPDHLLALWALPSGYWARRTAARAGLQYSVWALGSDVWGLGRVPVLRSMLKRVLRDASRNYADGIRLAEEVASLSGRDCEFLASSRRLPAVAARQKNTAPPYRLAFLGRWHPNKGVDVLLDALERLGDADWGRVSAVRICGGGPMHEDVMQRAAQLADGGRPVTVGGYLSAAEAAELLRWSDYLLVPSRVESIPVVFSDAAQSGTPIIATPVGDLPRLLLQYDVGILAPSTSADGLVHGIRDALSRNAREFAAGLELAARDFDVGAAARRFADSMTGQ